jgi:GntR family transcriptional regulator/MocR family aminotransferase
LVNALATTAEGLLEPDEATCGMHACVWLPDGVDGEAVFRKAAETSIEAMPLSRFSLKPIPRDGLVLGFAACEPVFIQPGIETLIDIVRSLKSSTK